MSVVMFKNGRSELVDPFSVDSYLKAGYFFDEEESKQAVAKEPVEEASEKIEAEDIQEKPGQEDAGEADGDRESAPAPKTNKEIRAAAKEAGIKKWDSKRIGALKKQLGIS